MVHADVGRLEAAPSSSGDGPEDPERVSLQAFEAFFRSHYGRLRGWAMLLGSPVHEADEVVSFTMHELRARWCDLTSPSGYAAQAVATNVKKARARQKAQDALTKGLTEADGYMDHTLANWETEEWMCQLLDKLPVKQREVIDALIAGLSYPEMTIMLGRNQDAIRRNVSDARRTLRREIDRQEMIETLGVEVPGRRVADEHR